MPDAVEAAMLETQGQHLLQQLAQLGDLRPGPLANTDRKCGHPPAIAPSP